MQSMTKPEPSSLEKSIQVETTLNWRKKVHTIVFGTETWAGKAFDVVLIVAILLSVTVVLLASVPSLQRAYGYWFVRVEWGLTLLFSIEYLARVWVSEKRWSYVFSFFGLIDLLSTVPTYLSLFIPGSESLLVIRLLRVLRIFRILKMGRYIREARIIVLALKASMYKIAVFISAVLVLVTILGTLMYLIEGQSDDTHFSSIPMSIYWSIVTLTTVGFGDIVPQTVLGQILASAIMLMGYAIIAVPTGLVTAEFLRKEPSEKDESIESIARDSKNCSFCGKQSLDDQANYCSHCGNAFEMLDLHE